MRLTPLGDGFDPALELPITLPGETEPRIYRVEPPNAELGLWTRRKAHLALQLGRAEGKDAERIVEQIAADPTIPGAGPDDEPEAIYLGTAFGQMITDRVPWPTMQHAAMTVQVWISLGDDAAATYWLRHSPESSAPNRADRRAKTSRATGGATTTKRPASTSGTNSRTTSNPKRNATTRSRGSKS